MQNQRFCVSVEDYVVELIRGQRKAPLLKPFLALLSQGVRLGVAIRNFAYDIGLFSSHRLPAYVISVGNITAGGTGKTPCVQLLASHLKEKLSLAILTRGFGSHLEKTRRIAQVDPRQEKAAYLYGDEPVLLAKNTSVPVWVGVDRLKSGSLAIAQGAQCLLLDDGMQHRRLARDIEIVVVDALDPFSQKRFLPYGFLRDSLSRLKTATLIVATQVHTLEQYKQIKEQLLPWSSAPVVGVRVEILNASSLPEGVALFCSLGNPERFLQTVCDLNRTVVHTWFKKDHAPFSEQELVTFATTARAKGACALVCTEKDAVKLPSGISCGLPLIVLRMQLRIVEGEEHWQGIEEIAKLALRVKKR